MYLLQKKIPRKKNDVMAQFTILSVTQMLQLQPRAIIVHALGNVAVMLFHGKLSKSNAKLHSIIVRMRRIK